MADFTQAKTFTANTPATAADQNDAWDNLEAYINATIAAVLADSGYTGGQIPVASSAGVPTMRTVSGDGTLSDTGVFAIGADVVDFDNLDPDVEAALGGGATARGKSIIATEEARTNTAYGTLTTADQVTGIVLPTDGLIVVAYQALAKQSVGGGNVAIFVGANQLKVADNATAAPIVSENFAGLGGTTYNHVSSWAGGLMSKNPGSNASQVTTGQAVGIAQNDVGGGGGDYGGGPCYIFAAAGTYTISVQFKASAGSITVKDRKLWVWTMGF